MTQVAYEKHKVQFEDQCESPVCGYEATHAVTFSLHRDSVRKRLCRAHAEEALSVAAVFHIGHEATRTYRPAKTHVIDWEE